LNKLNRLEKLSGTVPMRMWKQTQSFNVSMVQEVLKLFSIISKDHHTSCILKLPTVHHSLKIY
jgi:hypothetical protein